MSIAVMAYVWEHSSHGGNELLLLLAIADYADQFGIAWPSVATLAKRGRMSDRQAQRIIARLEQAGELAISKAKGPKGTHRYQVRMIGTLPLFGGETVDKTGDISGGDKMSPVTSRAKRGDIAMSPEPSGTVIKKRGQILPPTAKSSPAPQQLALAYIEYVDADRVRMAEYPAEESFLDIAKRFAKDYASKVERDNVSNVMIRIGAQERRFRREELTQ